MKILILYSGGLDSLIMKEYAYKTYPEAEVISVYFDIGHDYAYKEKAALPKDVVVHDMSWFQALGVGKDGNNTGSIFIPGRNLMFIVNAACKYLPDEIWLGALLGEIHDKATDKNFEFLSKLQDTLNYVLSPFKDEIKVRFPLVDAGWDKLAATEWALQNGMEKQVLKSSSCMSGEEGNCGTCPVCLRRFGIFAQLGIAETYNTHPMDCLDHYPMMIEMVQTEMAINEDVVNETMVHYDEHRRRELIEPLMWFFNVKTLADLKLALEQKKKELEDTILENNS